MDSCLDTPSLLHLPLPRNKLWPTLIASILGTPHVSSAPTMRPVLLWSAPDLHDRSFHIRCFLWFAACTIPCVDTAMHTEWPGKARFSKNARRVSLTNATHEILCLRETMSTAALHLIWWSSGWEHLALLSPRRLVGWALLTHKYLLETWLLQTGTILALNQDIYTSRKQ